MKKGIVTKSTGSSYFVMCDEGLYYECKLKSSFRLKNLNSTNPVAVGDKVQFELPSNKSLGLITVIEDRNNYIIRKSTNLSKRQHILASNIDQAILIVTLAFPRTSTGFIDRFLVTAEEYHIPAFIVFNKTDLFNEELFEYLDEIKSIYENIGYKCLTTSATKKTGLDVFSALLKDKISLLAGHSGVGKTALINAIQPSLNLKVGDISITHLKGKHTTTFAEMYPLSFGGFVIDIPGIKELGMIHVKPEEIAGYFPEMRALLPKCKFYNCTHTHEPNCAVLAAVENNEISLSRYHNYIGMLKDKGIEKSREWE
ncbi:MAG: ribosome small subunit-dependent GTPase A [Bacteroidetes bacterium]|nr:ribosome small subunit-dependent GTPase A [Bacteroidota bacterium]